MVIFQGPDELAWELNEVIANWAVKDPESGILMCQWAIGNIYLLTF